MSRRHDAFEAQARAADPGQSTWLSANAGSGKTRVLTDRVARLLLAGTEPQRILCLTYTKAAAAEMQVRLFDRLGRWAMLPDAALRQELLAMEPEHPVGKPPGPEALNAARRLFARSTDTPGGLKIQTIHSFCAALLRRFPLEAGVSPGFTEIEDRAGELARAEVAEAMASGAAGGGDGGAAGADAEARAALDGLAMLLSDEGFAGLLTEIGRRRVAFVRPVRRAEVMAAVGLAESVDMAGLLAEVFTGGEAEMLAALMPLLAESSVQDQRDGRKLAGTDSPSPDTRTIEALEAVLLGGKGDSVGLAKIGKFPTKALRDGAAAPLMPALEALMGRVEAARPRQLALQAAERTLALHRFARPFLVRYEALKAARGWLDFDDLIERAAALLADRGVAQWVLYRLDGGIDHILVDEAQDTSPGQWNVIQRLTGEFTAGQGARGPGRTLFVVGDRKQSIYSFQGADLAEFARVQADFRARFEAAGQPIRNASLVHSFRSAPAILDLVDATFETRANRGLGGETLHRAFDVDRPGRVDLWPRIEAADKAGRSPYGDTSPALPQSAPHSLLAARIAAEIRRLIDAGTVIATRKGDKRLDEGDILILLRSRNELFHEIIRACKRQSLAVAGSDRLKLGEEMAVRDIAALLRFLDTPEDDLSLAEALRSPLLGLSEAALYRLAAGRPAGGHLWPALRGAAATHPEAVAILTDLLGQSDYLRPFELIERLLIRHDGRRRLLARLGREAEEGIDGLLAQALDYERQDVPGLTGFLTWLDEGTEVKRRLDSGAGAIRVMTAHGAKGLEAPMVILPETDKGRSPSKDKIAARRDSPALWLGNKPDDPAALAAFRETEAEREAEEAMRLLYVAMTRAESWLIVAGIAKSEKAAKQGEGEDGWYAMVEAGMARLDAVPVAGPGEATAGFGPVLRYQNGTWPAPRPGPADGEAPVAALPDWVAAPAPALPAAPAPLTPTGLGGAKVLPGEVPAAGEPLDRAMDRGRRLHLLLEHLPHWPRAQWPSIAAALPLSGIGDDAAWAGLLIETLNRLLARPDLAALLTDPSALREVEFAATLAELGNRPMRGTIDLLLVGPELVLAVDYKSNALVPDRPEAVPEGILRQLGAYAAALALIYPGRRIETAVLWTETGSLMTLPPDIVRQALMATPMP